MIKLFRVVGCPWYPRPYKQRISTAVVGAVINLTLCFCLGRGIATLAVGLLLRTIVTYLVTFGNNLNRKERLFICIAWLPKATVQVKHLRCLVHASFTSILAVHVIFQV